MGSFLALIALFPANERAGVGQGGFRVEVRSGKQSAIIAVRPEIDGERSERLFERAWKKSIAAMHRQLDRNADGSLDPKEAADCIPPAAVGAEFNFGSGGGRVAYSFSAIDADADGKITPAELSEHYRSYGEGPFQPARETLAPPTAGTMSQRLFTLLDTNDDGKLSKAEVTVEAADFTQHDRDANEVLTVNELPTPQVGRMTVNVARPWEPNRETTDHATFRVLSEFDRAFSSPVDFEIIFRFGQRNGKKMVSVSQRSKRALAWIRFDIEDRIVRVFAGKTQIELHPSGGAPQLDRADDEFGRADANRDGKISGRETRSLSQLAGILDADDDGEITRAEFNSYRKNVRDQQAKFLAARLSLLRLPTASDLMGLLDRNRDGRLSAFEWKNISPKWLRWDKNNDGLLAEDEIPRTQRLLIARGEARANWTGPKGLRWSPVGYPLITLDLLAANLKWFFATDRNRDGVVTRREFLGPVDVFRKLDSNRDGMISVDEARTFKP